MKDQSKAILDFTKGVPGISIAAGLVDKAKDLLTTFFGVAIPDSENIGTSDRPAWITGTVAVKPEGQLAVGGPIQGRLPYLVGERGPELIIPKSSGTVIPNSQLTSGGGNNSATIDANSIAMLANALSSITLVLPEQGMNQT